MASVKEGSCKRQHRRPCTVLSHRYSHACKKHSKHDSSTLMPSMVFEVTFDDSQSLGCLWWLPSTAVNVIFHALEISPRLLPGTLPQLHSTQPQFTDEAHMP